MTSSVAASRPPHVPADPPAAPPRARRDKTHWLYLAVIVAVALGIAVGFAFPGKDGFAVKLQPLGTGFVSLIKMMITQLQNQDPLEPAKNQELLAQMSQIGQLQSQTLLQESLQSMVLQRNLGAAGNLIGKMVQGLDERGEPISGLVSSVRVEKNQVFLELDTGERLALGSVTEIAQPEADRADE